MNKVIIFISAFAVVLCLASCGGNSNSKVDADIPTEYCEELVKLAEDGNAEAQTNLGLCYLKGEGVTQSFEDAAKWFDKSANQNDAEGQYLLACLYSKGKGVQVNSQKSFKLLMESAQQGHADAQCGVAACYDYGENDIAIDHEEAIKWWRKAAEQGNARGQWAVGNYYFDNRDFAQAVQWFEKSANQGEALSQLLLGMCYFKGLGVGRDIQKGYDLVKKAAEQGDESAIKQLEILKSLIQNGTY